ncbi:MAG: FHA domain-containing protein [Sandaracinaceae bacterium]|nr:FHA domain-containing protein [Sandaracinaceae bacterium]
MNHDQNKKTLRQFQCRDYLWEIFEQMSAELECSVDYLINESMRQYARSRNYGVRTPGPGASRPGGPTPGAIPSLSGGGQPHIPSAPPPAQQGYGYGGGGGGYPPPPQPQQPQHPPPQQHGYGGGGGYPPPPRPSSYPPPPPTHRPPAYGQPPHPGMPPQQQYQPPGFGGPPPHSAPPPLPSGGGVPQHSGGGMIPLYVIFNGQKFPVAKEEFIIGRGTKTADLPIKDGNISRRHGAVIWQNGGWYIKDLGSTNGVEFQGRKIDSKRIEEGDVYQLCDYEVRFTYR